MSYSSVILSDTPLAYYKLDETTGTVAADTSGNSHDGTYTNTPTLGALSLLDDATGRAMSTVADSNQYVSVPFASWMNVNSFTVEGWAKFTANDTTNGDPILSRYTASDNYPMFLGRKFGGSALPGVQVVISGTRYNVFGTTPVPNNETHHYAATYDGTTIRAYLDGVEVANQAISGTVGWTSSPLEIARYSQTSTTVPGATIDEVAYYGTALSASRIAAHYAAGASTYKKVVLADAPIVYYRLDETSGTTAIDVSGGGNNGTYLNSPTLGVTGALAGDSDTAVTFVAASSHTMQTAFWSALNITTLTLECWVKTTGANQAICGRQGTTSVPYSMFVDASGKLELVVKTSGTSGTNYSDTSSTVINDGVWHHVAVTRDNTTATISFYVDGVLTSSIASTSAPNVSTSYGFAVSGRGGTPRLDGTIDEVALYGSALSAAKIAKHYAAGASAYSKEIVYDTPLVYYRLGELSGTVAADSSGNGQNGTYTNAPTLAVVGIPGSGSNKAVDFDGVNDYISVPNTGLDTGQSFTVEAWVKGVTSTGERTIVSRWGTAQADQRYVVTIDDASTGFPHVYLRAGGTYPQATANINILDGSWHHVVAAVNATNLMLYIDASLVSTVSRSGTSEVGNTLGIGAKASQLVSFFDGVIDEVAVYGTTLSSVRIAAHYAAAGISVLPVTFSGRWEIMG